MKYVTIYHGENGEINEEDVVVSEMTDWELKQCKLDNSKRKLFALIPISHFAHLLPHLTKAKSCYINKVEIEFKTDDGDDDSQEFEVGDIERFDEGGLPWAREIVKIKVLE
jgi:hypothetical protein